MIHNHDTTGGAAIWPAAPRFLDFVSRERALPKELFARRCNGPRDGIRGDVEARHGTENPFTCIGEAPAEAILPNSYVFDPKRGARHILPGPSPGDRCSGEGATDGRKVDRQLAQDSSKAASYRPPHVREVAYIAVSRNLHVEKKGKRPSAEFVYGVFHTRCSTAVPDEWGRTSAAA